MLHCDHVIELAAKAAVAYKTKQKNSFKVDVAERYFHFIFSSMVTARITSTEAPGFEARHARCWMFPSSSPAVNGYLAGVKLGDIRGEEWNWPPALAFSLSQGGSKMLPDARAEYVTRVYWLNYLTMLR